MPLDVDPEVAGDDDERVPLFGTWRRIYAAVVVVNLVFIVLAYLFGRWKP
jgi:hypothetical protein